MADSFTYSRRTGRYRDARGRFVSPRRIREAMDLLAGTTSERLAGLSRQLLAGELALPDWQLAMAQTLKASHLAAAMAARGGRAQMTPSDWGRVGQRLRTEYGYLQRFAEQIASGRQVRNGRLVGRARLFGQAPRVTFERFDAAAAQERGAFLEKNQLQSFESCDSCREQTRRGWVPKGQLTPVGQRTCRSNCRCVLIYREIARAG